MIEVRCFGEFQVFRNGQALSDLSLWKGRTRNIKLLKILLSPPGKHFSVGELIDALWPDEEKTEGNFARRKKEVRSAISELRKILEPDLDRGIDSQFIKSPQLEKNGYSFECVGSRCWIDSIEFQALVEKGKELASEGQWEDAEFKLESALELYSGDYIVEDEYEEWSFVYREELQEYCCDALLLLADCREERDEYIGAISYCEKALKLVPSRSEEIMGRLEELRSIKIAQQSPVL